MVDLHTFLVYKVFCKLMNYRCVAKKYISTIHCILKGDIKRLANTLPGLLPWIDSMICAIGNDSY